MKFTIRTIFALCALALTLAACATPADSTATQQPVSQTSSQTTSSDYSLDKGSEMRFMDATGNYIIIVNHDNDGNFSVEKRLSVRKDTCWLDASRDNGSICNLFGNELCVVNDGVKAHKLSDASQLTVTTELKPIKSGEFCYEGGD